MIDQNRDGFIDKEDLHDMLASLGKNPDDPYLEGMMNEAPGPINFTMFLTLFGERLQGTDPEDVIKNAFACFDEDNTGVIHEEKLRELLTTMGDRFTDEDVSLPTFFFFSKSKMLIYLFCYTYRLMICFVKHQSIKKDNLIMLNLHVSLNMVPKIKMINKNSISSVLFRDQ